MEPEDRELVLNLCAIHDVKQRSYALASRFLDLADDHVVSLMKAIQEEASLGQGESCSLYAALTVTSVLNEVLGDRKMSRLIAAAQRRQEFSVVSLLMDVRTEVQHDAPFQPFLDSSLKDVPLGIRKALARRPDFKLIQRIARDQDHRVIEHLLDNPRLTEADVVKIGSTRPTSPKVLQAIYEHRKWINRYSVKKTIVFNPYAPLSMALRLLPFMRLQDLEEIISSSHLDPVLVQEASRARGKKGKVNHHEETLDF
ncbi:MAG TPA: hypothetical protein VK463_11660 [Desulfomonilaceae bacterium]|nr:hypothetical protein [Desulfomonilaceae bacterium]